LVYQIRLHPYTHQNPTIYDIYHHFHLLLDVVNNIKDINSKIDVGAGIEYL